MRDLKIFISPFKGGTTSAAVALGMVGFRRWNSAELFGTDNWTDKFKNLDRREKDMLFLLTEAHKVAEHFERFEAITPKAASEIERLAGGVMRYLMRDYDVADDYPLGHDMVHPYVKKIIFKNRCKFVFLERPMDEYVESVKRHVLNRKYKHIFGHNRKLFIGSELGKTKTIANYVNWKSRYLDLKKLFPNDVLIMDLKDGWQPLASFLEFEIPKMDFPWANKSEVDDKNACLRCGHKINHSEQYDSDYCPICLEWMEGKCLDKGCEICRMRPEKPIVQVED